MFLYNRKNYSYLVSLTLHLILALIFMFINFSIEYDEEDYVTLGFGTFGNVSSAGAAGIKDDINKSPEKTEPEKEKREDKKVELPKTQNTDTDNIVTASDPKKEKEKPVEEKVKPLVEKDDGDSKGKEVTGEGEGNFGFEIDFGGKGIRKIYSYSLPAYPEGVSKEIDVKLRFTILPDGSVGKIIPLIKADTKLEMAAINSLRQWRFEPLPNRQKQSEQNAVIVFPYRLQ